MLQKVDSRGGTQEQGTTTAVPALADTDLQWSKMMHQQGHEFHGTTCGNGCELAARWAARRLITPRALLAAGRTHGGHLPAVALALRVTMDDLRTYIDDLSDADRRRMVKLVFDR